MTDRLSLREEDLKKIQEQLCAVRGLAGEIMKRIGEIEETVYHSQQQSLFNKCQPKGNHKSERKRR